MPALRVYNRNEIPNDVELGERTTLGRSLADSDIQVKDAESSRVHAEVVLRDGTYYARDLDSSNGTRVNGETITEAALHHGDRIEIGTTAIEFIDEETAVLGPTPVALEPTPEPEPDRLVLPGYTLTERLGADTLTETHAATDDALGRPVAVEVVNADHCPDPAAALATIRRAAALEHPATARIHAAGSVGGRAYFVREPATGTSLWRLCGKLEPEEIIEAGIAIAGAVAEAHSVSLVHGTIRPDRIVRTDRGHFRLLGLGLPAPKIGELSTEPDLQKSPNRIAYMPPEQLDEGPSESADIYSLGATLYHALCGRVPFGAVSEADLAPKLSTEAVIPVPQLRPETPEPLAALIEKMLLRNPLHRPRSMVEVQGEFQRMRLRGADRGAPAAEPRPARAATPRRSAAAGCTIVVLAILLLAAVFLLSRVGGISFIRLGGEPASSTNAPTTAPAGSPDSHN